MQNAPDPEVTPMVPPADQRSHELVARIRKLRWIGRDDDARLLEKELERKWRSISAEDCVLAAPGDTD